MKDESSPEEPGAEGAARPEGAPPSRRGATRSRSRSPATLDGAPRRTIALLSLFDGLGTARLALDRALFRLREQGRLAASAFVELDADLSGPVSQLWQEPSLSRGTPHVHLADDVWDLFRHRMQALHSMINGLRLHTLLLIIGGSPC